MKNGNAQLNEKNSKSFFSFVLKIGYLTEPTMKNMKKNWHLTIAFFVCFCNTSFSQSFEIHISNGLEMRPYSVAEDDEGNYYVVGRYLEKRWSPFDHDTLKAFIVKIDAQGNILKEKYLNDQFLGELKDVVVTNNGEILAVGGLAYTGHQGDNEHYQLNAMRIAKFDKDLELKWVKEYWSNERNDHASLIYIKADAQGNYWAGGDLYYTPAYSLLKINSDGDSLDFSQITIHGPLHVNCCSKIKSLALDENHIMATVLAHDTADFYHRIEKFNYQTQLESSSPFPRWTENNSSLEPFRINGSVVINNTFFANAAYWNYTNFTNPETGVTGVYITYKMHLARFDASGNSSLIKILGKLEDDTVSIMPGGLSYFDNNLYITGNYDNFHFLLTKTDIEGNIKWQRFFGDGKSVINCNNTLATKDGGCIMVGIKTKDPIFENSSDLYVIKVDPDGNINTSVKETSKKEWVNVYPNPASDNIQFLINFDQYSLTITDFSGREFFNVQSTGKSINVNLTSFPNGIYLYQIIGEGKIQRGKFIKN
jgi:hypothetical protein